MLWRWLVRTYGVETALWLCYWESKKLGYAFSVLYCYKHSWLVRNYSKVLFYVVVMGGCCYIVFGRLGCDDFFTRALARSIYADYTDRIESFGIDEAWVSLTGSTLLFGDGVQVADIIRRRMREELGITAPVGVSFNKIFAKLGSDMKKPDASFALNGVLRNYRYQSC